MSRRGSIPVSAIEEYSLFSSFTDCLEIEYGAAGLAWGTARPLGPSSQSVDAGVWLDSYPCNEDINGTLHFIDGNADGTVLPDIGAYEYVRGDTDSDGDGISDSHEVAMGRNPLRDESRIIIDAETRGESQGESNVTSNPIAYDLYTSNTIMSLNMGYHLQLVEYEDARRASEKIDRALFFVRLVLGLEPFSG